MLCFALARYFSLLFFLFLGSLGWHFLFVFFLHYVAHDQEYIEYFCTIYTLLLAKEWDISIRM